jgi:hypothetical protein
VRRRALLLVPLAAVLAGCGRNYSDADVRASLHPASVERGVLAFPPERNTSSFATWDAVTELRFDEPPRRVPALFYDVGGVRVVRLGGAYEASRSLTRLRDLAAGARRRNCAGVYVARRGNVIAIGSSRAVVDAALERLP